jgi:uncharacterized membrane protein YkvA (DUF1232 family)
MSNPSATLESFATWLQDLAADVVALSEVLEAEATRPPASSPKPDAGERRRAALELLAGGLNSLFKSIDLIQDGIEDLGYIDDCFVLRVCAASALPGVSVRANVLQRLEADADLVREFLGDQDFARLERYVAGTRELKARGRTPREIVEHEDVLESFVQEVAAWAKAYQAPTFSRDEKNLARLRSFLAARLPS